MAPTDPSIDDPNRLSIPRVPLRTASEAQNRINLFWLLQLRWGAAAGQIVTILGVLAFKLMPVPVAALFAIIAVELLSNVAFTVWARRLPDVSETAIASIMVADILLLTGLLFLTGGPFNPFCFLYLVHIALAAVILRARWAWALAGLSVACLGALFLVDMWGDAPMDHAAHMARMDMHVEGMWVAMVVAAAFIVYFVTRVTRALADRELELATAREKTARQDRLASLASLSAGAAHELSTPLSTIAVVAKELELQLVQQSADEGAIEDAKLIRTEVARCRSILDHMAADAGQSSGESSTRIGVADLLDESIEGLAEPERVEVHIDPAVNDACLVHVPPRSVSQVLRVALKNALDASPAGNHVEMKADLLKGSVRVAIVDRGCGMTPEVLARVGEPFFTTKGPGSGMGLGLFLSRAVIERVGGSLAIESTRDVGTKVTVLLPQCDSPPPAVASLHPAQLTETLEKA